MLFLAFIVALAVIAYYTFNYLEGNLPYQYNYKSAVWNFGTLQPKVVITEDKLIVYLFGMIIASRPLLYLNKIEYQVVSPRTARLVTGAPTYIGASIWVPKTERSEKLVAEINEAIKNKTKNTLNHTTY